MDAVFKDDRKDWLFANPAALPANDSRRHERCGLHAVALRAIRETRDSLLKRVFPE